MPELELSAQRDFWLSAEDSVLLRDCRFEAFHASGHGGQKVNKSSSAVRVTHLPSGLSASSQESRSQAENRVKALKRLRLEMAFCIRKEPQGGFALEPAPAERNPSYPQYVACLLDALSAAEWDLKASALALGASPSRLAKLLARSPRLWQELQAQRAKCGLPSLRPVS